MDNNRQPLLAGFHIALILIFAAKYLLSSVTVLIPYTVFLVLELLYFAFCFLYENSSVRWAMFGIAILILLLSFLYYFFTVTSTVSVGVSHYNLKRFFTKFNQLVNFFFPILLLHNYCKLKEKHRHIILLIVMALFSYVVVHSTVVFFSGEGTARKWGTFSELKAENVATYFFVYAASALIPSLFGFLRKNKNRALQIATIVYILLLYVCLFSSQYTLAIVIPTACIILSVVRSQKKERQILFLFIMLFVLVLTPVILSLLVNVISPENQIRSRLMSVIEVLRGEVDSNNYNHLEGRLTLYRKCLQYFFKSPLIGNRTVPFDGHATFLTMLCDLGLLGVIPGYTLYFSSRRAVRSIVKNKKLYSLWFFSFLSLMITGFVNPIHSAEVAAYSVYFIGPALLKFKFDGEKHEQV